MSRSRNIVILGKVGSGKRTLGNHIADSKIFQIRNSLSIRRENATFQYEEVTGGKTDIVHRILIVDTESLQSRYNDPVPYIKKEFREIQEIHLVIFTIPHGLYTGESHGSLVRTINRFSLEAKRVSALVITHCEGMTVKQRQAIVTEFARNTHTSPVVDFMQHGTHTVGFPDLSTLPPKLKPILQNEIERDGENIRELVERCEASLSLKDLPESGTQPARMQEKHDPGNPLPIKDLTPKTARGKPLHNQRAVIIVGHGLEITLRALGDCLSDQKVFGESTEVDGQALYSEFPEGDPAYRILIVNTEVLNLGISCIKSNSKFSAINLIIFVISSTDKDFHWLESLSQNTDPKCSALVITDCEGETEQERSDSFKDNTTTASIAKRMGKGIYTVGFPGTTTEDKIANDAQILKIKDLVRECTAPFVVSPEKKCTLL